MLYSKIPGIDKPVSRLVLGTMWINTKNPDTAFPVLDAFYAAGGNCLDTAHGYGGGDNERAVGQWINERGLRDEIVILGKGAHHSQDRKRVTPYDIKSDLHDSLARFKVDSIDLYVLHRDDPDKAGRPDRRDSPRSQRGRPNRRLRRLQLERRSPARGQRIRRRERPDPLRRQQPPV